MIQNIDFLPASFHQERHGRQSRVWRRGVLLVFLALVAAGTAGQWRIRAGLEASRDRLREQAELMTAQVQGADTIRKEIEALDARADLLTHLQIQARPTRVLASVVNARPKFVTLTEIRAAYEKRDGPRAAAGKPRPKDQTAPARLPEVLDLERLRDERRQRAQIVTVGGIAPDNEVVARYVGTLQRTGTFDDVQLVYMRQYEYGEHRLRQFELKLRVRRIGT